MPNLTRANTLSSEFKPALIQPLVLSMWGSCQTIMPNLDAAYRRAFGADLLSFNFGRETGDADCMHTAIKIHAAKPTHLIFVDHERHPKHLLLALDLVYRNKPWPQLIFHVYGDFSLFTREWHDCEALLRGKQVTFVCASPRQQKFVANFFLQGRYHTRVCPFPVAENEFHFEPGLRGAAREEFGLTGSRKKDFTIIYTGRLSAQKNILRLVWDVANKCDEAKIPFRLLLAGAFDDLGSAFFGLQQKPNDYFSAYKKMLALLPAKLQTRVQHVGSLNKAQLKRFYHAGDLFVSFSTHHDEDYGMSPIESLFCGTPALISDWGGFAGFAVSKEAVRVLPVKLGTHGPQLKTDRLKRHLADFYLRARKQTEETRATRARFFADRFGVEPSSQLLKDWLRKSTPRPFVGATPHLVRHALLSDRMRFTGYMFEASDKKIDANYRTFYQHYCTQE